MAPNVGYSTPLLHVADVARSIRFYELLGFQLVDWDGEDQELGWARVHCEGGALMFLLASEPIDTAAQAILLYMYTTDLEGLRQQLLAQGVAASPITYPEYMPSGEMSLRDPDGYAVLVGHWGKTEQETWEKRVAEKRKQRPGTA